MVPTNVRQASEHLELGNKVSSLFVHLPVAEETVLGRYRRVSSRRRKRSSPGRRRSGTSTIISLAGMAPPAIHATLARSLYATRLFNVTVTNVPGPQATLYADGAPLREILPLVPLAAEHAVGVAIVSYDGQVFYGINVAADAVPDLAVLRDAIADEIEALQPGCGRSPRALRGLTRIRANYPPARRIHTVASSRRSRRFVPRCCICTAGAAT